MLTGDPPWKSLGFQSAMALMYHISASQTPPPMPEWFHKHPLLYAFLLKCFERDVNKRPGAKELLFDPFFHAHNEETDDEEDGASLASRQGSGNGNGDDPQRLVNAASDDELSGQWGVRRTPSTSIEGEMKESEETYEYLARVINHRGETAASDFDYAGDEEEGESLGIDAAVNTAVTVAEYGGSTSSSRQQDQGLSQLPPLVMTGGELTGPLHQHQYFSAPQGSARGLTSSRQQKRSTQNLQQQEEDNDGISVLPSDSPSHYHEAYLPSSAYQHVGGRHVGELRRSRSKTRSEDMGYMGQRPQEQQDSPAAAGRGVSYDHHHHRHLSDTGPFSVPTDVSSSIVADGSTTTNAAATAVVVNERDGGAKEGEGEGNVFIIRRASPVRSPRQHLKLDLHAPTREVEHLPPVSSPTSHNSNKASPSNSRRSRFAVPPKEMEVVGSLLSSASNRRSTVSTTAPSSPSSRGENKTFSLAGGWGSSSPTDAGRAGAKLAHSTSRLKQGDPGLKPYLQEQQPPSSRRKKGGVEDGRAQAKKGVDSTNSRRATIAVVSRSSGKRQHQAAKSRSKSTVVFASGGGRGRGGEAAHQALQEVDLLPLLNAAGSQEGDLRRASRHESSSSLASMPSNGGGGGGGSGCGSGTDGGSARSGMCVYVLPLIDGCFLCGVRLTLCMYLCVPPISLFGRPSDLISCHLYLHQSY